MDRQPIAPPTSSRSPIGFYPCKIDSAGRLKFPSRYQDYIQTLPDKYLFVTEFNGLARIFTWESWTRMIDRISDSGVRNRTIFRASERGAEVEMDPQGRITLPQVLRKRLNLEDQFVQVGCTGDVITILPQAAKDEESKRIEPFEQSDMERMNDMGIDL